MGSVLFSDYYKDIKTKAEFPLFSIDSVKKEKFKRPDTDWDLFSEYTQRVNQKIGVSLFNALISDTGKKGEFHHSLRNGHRVMYSELKGITPFLDLTNACIVDVDESDLETFLCFLINMSIYPTDNHLIYRFLDFFDRDSAVRLLTDDSFFDINQAIVGVITFHNNKLIDSGEKVTFVSSGYIPPKVNSDYISSGDVDFIKEIDFCGKSSLSQNALLMATEFVFNGKITSYFKALSGQDQELLSAITNLSPEFSHFTSLMVELVSSLQSEQNDVPNLQLLIPTDNAYVSVSPTINVGFARIFSDTLGDFKKKTLDERYISQRMSKVGGGNPVNVGSYNASKNGFHATLFAKMPTIIEGKHDRLINRYQHYKTLITSKHVSDFSFLEMSIEYYHQRLVFEEFLPMVMFDYFKDIRYAQNLAKQGYLLDGMETRLDDHERKLVFKEKMSTDEIKALSLRCVALIMKSIPEKHRFLIDTKQKIVFYTKAVEHIIREMKD